MPEDKSTQRIDVTKVRWDELDLIRAKREMLKCGDGDSQYGYELYLMSVVTANDLLNRGRSLVIVALVNMDLYIRIFDQHGEKVVDKTEDMLVSGKTLTALKQSLDPFPDESSLSPEDKQKIIGDATSVAGHTPQYEAPNDIDIDDSAWKNQLFGLALSGGGIRSATFNLGILQALARHKLLRRVDYLSTVSGGGYIGGWFTALLQREHHRLQMENFHKDKKTSKKAIETIEERLYTCDAGDSLSNVA